jgi:hypothetical protein
VRAQRAHKTSSRRRKKAATVGQTKALLHGADLRGANLYQADMAMAVGDENTHLDDAMIVRVRGKPRWQDKVRDPE